VVTENARVAAAVAALQAGDPAAAGALGAGMTGGGFGGAVIALVPRHRVTALTQATQEAFTTAGFATPGVRTRRRARVICSGFPSP
jgi:galactokinase